MESAHLSNSTSKGKEKKRKQNADVHSGWDSYRPGLFFFVFFWFGSRRMTPAPSCGVTSENDFFLHPIRNTGACDPSPGSGLRPGLSEELTAPDRHPLPPPLAQYLAELGSL